MQFWLIGYWVFGFIWKLGFGYWNLISNLTASHSRYPYYEKAYRGG